MKFSAIKNKALTAARNDVADFYQDNGAEALAEANSPSQLGWDESAINAGVFEIVCGRHEGDAARSAFYEAYAREAKQEAQRLLSQ